MHVLYVNMYKHIEQTYMCLYCNAITIIHVLSLHMFIPCVQTHIIFHCKTVSKQCYYKPAFIHKQIQDTGKMSFDSEWMRKSKKSKGKIERVKERQEKRERETEKERERVKGREWKRE